MTSIFNKTYGRTLDELVETAAGEDQTLQVWTFDDRASRVAAEKKLAQSGVNARIRSAYKPLLHYFLEEVDLSDVIEIAVSYPVHERAPKNRFILETYPLAALAGDIRISLAARSDDDFHYGVTLTLADGSTASHSVFAPNRVHVDFVGETIVSPTGWVIIGAGPGERLETDYERLFAETVSAIQSHDWGTVEPYFEELNIRATLPSTDEPLAHGDEVLSLREALHEDFYFSLLEVFQQKSGRPIGDRGLRPGQIVPEIVQGEATAVAVSVRPLSSEIADGPVVALDTMAKPPFFAQVVTELDAIGGQPFEAASRSGRPVLGRYVKGNDAPVIISGGQHANENTGIVGAMRAAKVLARRQNAHFTVCPMENPDGYALHQRLRADNPRHMHHAARYTAMGDDLEYRTLENTGGVLHEKAIRIEAQRLTDAQLHVNLHGYPSHEWTRPLSGYVPRNFAMWTLPKGFFLVMRYHAGWEARAERMLDHVTAHLGKISGLLAYNDAQIALYEVHAGETGFRIINGFPCLCSVDDRHTTPLTLVTEYPDETIYGDDFIAGHTAQMETVLSAYEAMQEISAIG
ncbi:M14 family metallopeptidase [Aminobacter sp. AP02]|uniref:M14 family metallopeptidase n=1 Tax=Aminobacter sp. AP02 TaxID=2135737 RepID=UPI000D6AD0B3|nr:M14 family metallopeptidase [Aminobacter sp. AP02]PWK68998.1 hypothetical protein C8K44_10928 [Aminobacter sp. AP02]